MSVTRAAGTPESELVEQAFDPAYAFDAVLLSRLRSELGLGNTTLLVDVSLHVLCVAHRMPDVGLPIAHPLCAL
eukprot:6389799-Prymnesium_polylepis.1